MTRCLLDGLRGFFLFVCLFLESSLLSVLGEYSDSSFILL